MKKIIILLILLSTTIFAQENIFDQIDINKSPVVDSLIILAEQGDVFAQDTLGSMYYNGHGVTLDYKEALKWWKKGAEQGYSISQFNLGWILSGDNGFRDDIEGLKWFKKSANQGYSGAQFIVGRMYYNGERITLDYKEAFYWFEKSATQGDAVSQYRIGYMLLEGQGITINYKEAFLWFKKAAIQGNDDSQYALGAMYISGFGVIQDNIEGYAWASLSSVNGNKSYIEGRDLIANELSSEGLEKGQARAKELYNQINKNKEEK